MSDGRLRKLERAWAESGAVADHAALIRERLRAGFISENFVTLAAHLRDEAAAMVCPPPPVAVSQSGALAAVAYLSSRLSPFGGWALAIEPQQKVAFRAAIAVTRWFIPRLLVAAEAAEAEGLAPEAAYGYVHAVPGAGTLDLLSTAKRVQGMLLLAEQLAMEWTESNVIKVISASVHIGRTPGAREPQGFANLSWLREIGTEGLVGPPVDGWFESACYGAILWDNRQWSEECENHPRPTIAAQGWFGLDPCMKCLIRCMRELQERVRVEVVPWLLDEGDPLAELRKEKVCEQAQAGRP